MLQSQGWPDKIWKSWKRFTYFLCHITHPFRCKFHFCTCFFHIIYGYTSIEPGGYQFLPATQDRHCSMVICILWAVADSSGALCSPWAKYSTPWSSTVDKFNQSLRTPPVPKLSKAHCDSMELFNVHNQWKRMKRMRKKYNIRHLTSNIQ